MDGQNKEHLQSIPVYYFGDTVAKFKFLLQLKSGVNHVSLEYFRIRRNLAIKYEPPPKQEIRHQVKLLYIVCSDSQGDFQSPCEPNHSIHTKNKRKAKEIGKSNDVASAKKRISLSGYLIQCILAESLEVHGLGRKTIQFYNEQGDNGKEESFDNKFYPETYVFKSKLSTKEVYSMNQRQLWEYHAKEIISSEENKTLRTNAKLKYLAIHSATQFCNPSGKAPNDHAEVLSLTKGHVSIGGGDFALLGSGCLYTWPENLSEVIPAFSDATDIDSTRFMDDSAYRKTVGGCYATTLGALIHELGHTFDLGHAANGFMARGFDDIDRFFTLSNKVQNKLEKLSKNEASLMCCMSSSVNKQSPSPFHYPSSPFLSGTTSTKKGTNYLEEYQQKQYYRKMMNEFGNAYWDKSSALILSAHKWLNLSVTDDADNQISYLKDIKQVQSLNSDILLLELRDKSGNILEFLDLSSEESCQFIDLNPYIDRLGPKLSTFLCINCDGDLLKNQI